DRLHDVLIAGAPAKISLEPVADLILGRTRIAIEQLRAGDDHSRSAITALEAVVFPEAFLNGVKLTVCRKPFDRCYARPIGLHCEYRARLYRLAIDKNRTRAANRCFTTDVSSGQA